jgi:hypothetical protein
VVGPRPPDDLDLSPSQQLLDGLREYKIRSDRLEFAIDLRVDRLGGAVTTALRFIPPDVRKAATLTEPFPRPRTGDRGYRNDTVVVSAYGFAAKTTPSQPIVQRSAAP